MTRVLNPCDDELAQHIRFEKKTGKMVPTSVEGRFFEDMFRLNEEDAPKQRLAALGHLELASERYAKVEKAIKAASKKLSEATTPAEIERLTVARNELQIRLEEVADMIARQLGTLPLKALSSRLVEVAAS